MRTTNLYKGFLITFLALSTIACNSTSIEGAWVQPAPGMFNLQQGFTLEAEGKASSIRMATLQYERWRQEGNQLILSGKSIGNRQTILFSDTLTIERLTSDSLILTKNNYIQAYSRDVNFQKEH